MAVQLPLWIFVCYVIFGLIVVAVNIITIVGHLKIPQLKKASLYFILNIAVSDAMFGVAMIGASIVDYMGYTKWCFFQWGTVGMYILCL